MIALANAVPTFILRSPLHRLMSGHYALLRMVGRRSGNTITIPVAYIRRGAAVIVSTDSLWRVNVTDGRRVEMLVAGRWMQAAGRRVTDGGRAAELLGELTRQVPGYARPAGLPTERGRVPVEALAESVAEHRWVLTVTEVA